MPNADCEFALKDGVLEFKEPARRLPSTWVQGTIVNSFTVGPQQQVWKRRVASAIKRVRDGSPWDPRDLYAVTLEFRFHPGNHQNQELDVENYVKPVVDAVAAGLFLEEERDPSEIQTWAFPDSNFRTLLIHRAADPKDRSREGVHISVSVRRGQQNPASVRGPGGRSPTGAATSVQRGAKRLLSLLGRWIEPAYRRNDLFEPRLGAHGTVGPGPDQDREHGSRVRAQVGRGGEGDGQCPPDVDPVNLKSTHTEGALMAHQLAAALARIGMQCLDEAVMAVLVNANQPLGPAEISRRAGIDRDVGFGKDKAIFDSLTTGTLARLFKEKRVSRPERGRYEPTR